MFRSTRRMQGLRRFWADRRGSISGTLALGGPTLIMLLMGGIDISLALNQMSALNIAAKAGLQHAMRSPSRAAEVFNAIKRSIPNGTPPSMAVSSVLHCECPRTGKVTSCVGSAQNCDGQAPDVFRTVTVTLSMPYSSPLPTSRFIKPTALSRSATFRVH
jgi:Flp pilus assembly protein TadG